MEFKNRENSKCQKETIKNKKYLSFKRLRKEIVNSEIEDINNKILNSFNNSKDNANDNILIKIDNHIKQLSKLKNCKECGKENIKLIKDKNDFFNLLNEFLKIKFNTEDIKRFYEDIIIDCLCEDCIYKEIIIGGINNLLNNINKNNNGMINSISQFFIASFIKRFETINKSMEKITKETTTTMNKMIVHLMLNKNKLQFSQFNEDMNKYSNLLKKIYEDYSNLYKSMIDENEILNTTINNINNSILNTFTTEKFQKIVNQIKEINNETIFDNEKKMFTITNPFNNINNDIEFNEDKNPFQKSSLMINHYTNNNESNRKINNLSLLNNIEISKDLNEINFNDNNISSTNNFIQSLNNDLLLNYPSININSNNLFPLFNDSLNNNEIFKDDSDMSNFILNQLNEFFNMKLFPSNLIDEKNETLFNQFTSDSNKLFSYFNNIQKDLLPNIYNNIENNKDYFVDTSNDNLKNMFNELATQKDIKNNNPQPDNNIIEKN